MHGRYERAENVLLWLQATDSGWMAEAELCLDSSREAEPRVFQVRENSEENSLLPEDMLVAFHLLSLFVTRKYCAKGLGVPVTFNGQRPV